MAQTDYTKTGIVPATAGNPDIYALGKLLRLSHDDLSIKTEVDASGTVAGCCKHANINIWSKHKPMNINKLTFISDDERTRAMAQKNWGLRAPSPVVYMKIKDLYPRMRENDKMNGWAYDKPSGLQTSPFRSGDFRGYNHCAKIPFGDFCVNGLNGNEEHTMTEWSGGLAFTIKRHHVDEATNIVLGDLGVTDKYLGVVVEYNDGIPGSDHLEWDTQDMYKVLCKKGTGVTAERLPISMLTDIPDQDEVTKIFEGWFELSTMNPDITQVRFYPVTYKWDRENDNEVEFCSIPELMPVTIKVEHGPRYYITCDMHFSTSDFENVFVAGTIYTDINEPITGKISFETLNDAGQWTELSNSNLQAAFKTKVLEWDGMHDVMFGNEYSHTFYLGNKYLVPGGNDFSLERIRAVVKYDDYDQIDKIRIVKT